MHKSIRFRAVFLFRFVFFFRSFGRSRFLTPVLWLTLHKMEPQHGYMALGTVLRRSATYIHASCAAGFEPGMDRIDDGSFMEGDVESR
ncbi:hypothetical protein F4860DRAFT_491713 [Xylaria cubensis]|nr:hypothetical protein F4860DRAFT_491713 [Xylaria cubensis]